MDFEIGIACGQCDAYSPMGASRCPLCANELSLNLATAAPSAAPSGTPDSPAAAPQPPIITPREELMEQAKHYVCRACSTAVPSGHKFCGTCGGKVPLEIVQLQNDYFGPMQTPGKARLILIRGESGVDGLSYMLQGVDHVAGRQDGQILFPEDDWLSPRHANFVYEGGHLVVRDEGSLNGVYLRVREPVNLALGGHFLCGEQVFRVQAAPQDDAGPDPDQTYFYASPKASAAFQVVQVLRGGIDGIVLNAREGVVEIGREGVDLNFPEDVYMSGSHARIELGSDGHLRLSDMGSKNGTYVRIQDAQTLQHGDYLFLGKQLLRVEMTVA